MVVIYDPALEKTEDNQAVMPDEKEKMVCKMDFSHSPLDPVGLK